MPKKRLILVGIDEEQATWLDEKTAQGYKKSSLIRFLIKECMSRKESWDNPMELKRLKPKEKGPWIDKGGMVRHEPAGKPPRRSERPRKYLVKQIRITQKRVEEPRPFNPAPFEAFRKNPSDIANIRNIEIELIAWAIDHPDEPLPKELQDMKTQYYIERWKKETSGTGSI